MKIKQLERYKVNNIQIANETIKIIAEGQYMLENMTISLPDLDYKKAEIFSPEDGKSLLEENISQYFREGFCDIEVTCEDSFAAARRLNDPIVMNFANAHKAGGGFRLGANAQEEALCRCSTLYASITSPEAAEMYRYNNTHISAAESDYMLLSPEVCVFRNEYCELLEQPFTAAVITLPAPNRRGAAVFASKKLIEETMTRRIRIMLRIAAKYGYRELVLGAWGCGAFGNPPEDVSCYFKKVLIGEEYGRCFDRTVFAIYGKPDGRNITAFRKTFEK